MIAYNLLDPVLEDKIVKDDSYRRSILLLQKSRTYPFHYEVDCYSPMWLEDYFDLVGLYRCVHVLKLSKLAERAAEQGHEIIFLDDPSEQFDFLTSLDEPFEGEDAINFTLKKFQRRGLNFLKDNRADIVEWSTGTGKTVFGATKARYLLDEGRVEMVVVVSKAHNRINWVRALEEVANIKATFVGYDWNEKKQRYVEVGKKKEERLAFRDEQYNSSQVFVVNYEKFRNDEEEIMAAVKGKSVYFIWDEMPTRLKNKATKVWQSVSRAVLSAKDPWHSILSATNVENSPEDVFNCIQIIKRGALGSSLQDFRKRYVREWSYFGTSMKCPACKGSGTIAGQICRRCDGEKTIKLPPKVAEWDMQKLPEIGMRLSGMLHKADKYRDPEIAAEFPSEQWDQNYLEISKEDAKLYDWLRDQIESEFNGGADNGRILQLMGILQLVVNNPAVLAESESELAELVREKHPNWITDKHCAKLDYLKDLLADIQGKVVLFSSYNDYGSKMLSRYLKEWGISHVVYDGTPQQKQAAQDAFKSDPSIKVFVSSDQGSDSINLQEATTVINYDNPWKWSTKLQRVNRINRITSKSIGHDHVTYIDLLVAGTVEDRRVALINRKRGYQTAIYDTNLGDAASDLNEMLDMTSREELYWILTGKEKGA